HTRFDCDWSSDVCSSDHLAPAIALFSHQLTQAATVPCQPITGLLPTARVRAMSSYAPSMVAATWALWHLSLRSVSTVTGSTFLRSEERRVGEEWCLWVGE